VFFEWVLTEAGTGLVLHSGNAGGFVISLIENYLASVITLTITKRLVKKFVIYDLEITFYWWLHII